MIIFYLIIRNLQVQTIYIFKCKILNKHKKKSIISIKIKFKFYSNSFNAFPYMENTLFFPEIFYRTTYNQY